MLVIFLQQLSGVDSHDIGDKIELDDDTAKRYIDKEIAKAKSTKEHNALMARIQKKEDNEAQIAIKVLAVQKEAELKNRATALIKELKELEQIIQSIDNNFIIFEGEKIKIPLFDLKSI